MTASPWPIGRLPSDEPEYWFGCSTMPGDSPGRSTPVGFPKPNARTHLSKRIGPSRWPIFTAPTFEDWARICFTWSVMSPRGSASLIVRSATW